MTTIPFGTKRQQPRVASTTFFHDMIKKYFFGLNHFWVWLIRLSLTDAHSLTSWIYIFWKKTPWFVWWERLNSLAIFSLSIQYWRTQRATEGKRKDTCFLFSFPNVSGNKEELCLNYLSPVRFAEKISQNTVPADLLWEKNIVLAEKKSWKVRIIR